MTKIAINENGFCVVGLFGKAAHLVSRKVWCGIFPERDVMFTNLIDAIYPVKAMAVQIQKQSGVKQGGISFARIAPLHGVKGCTALVILLFVVAAQEHCASGINQPLSVGGQHAKEVDQRAIAIAENIAAVFRIHKYGAAADERLY